MKYIAIPLTIVGAIFGMAWCVHKERTSRIEEQRLYIEGGFEPEYSFWSGTKWVKREKKP